VRAGLQRFHVDEADVLRDFLRPDAIESLRRRAIASGGIAIFPIRRLLKKDCLASHENAKDAPLPPCLCGPAPWTRLEPSSATRCKNRYSMKINNDVVDAIGHTPLIRLNRASEATGCTILGKAEFMNPGQ
jgi:hypothetical protein